MTGQSTPRRVHLAGALSLLAWAGLAWASRGPAERHLGAVLGAHVVAWAALGWLAMRPAGISFRVLAGWAAAFWLCALAARPVLDDDVWRFLWDGRMLVRTGNPFGTAPAEHFHDPALPPRFAEILDRVNHPDLPTVYGPAAQLAFGVAYLAGPGRLWPWRLILAAAALGLALAVRRLAADRPDEARSRAALLVLWCPLLVFETGFNAHPDLLGVTWITLAVLAAGRRRGPAAGATSRRPSRSRSK
ncbi:MAG TPA: hypothetical protein PKE47_15075, partial [Verrucomicrobiota bacterium]|nr:hypothetical protein [Verrucomicrobiota bacterium]